MKERQLICNAREVRAIQSGAMTQTRRIVKPQPVKVTRGSSICGLPVPIHPDDYAWPIGHGCVTVSCKPNGPTGWAEEHSPYGQPGDRLWVKESLKYVDHDPVRGDDAHLHCFMADIPVGKSSANPYECHYFTEFDGSRLPRRSVPSIHMPRRCSRITLEITSVRVERLQAISEEDAIAEGVTAVSSGGVTLFTTTGVNCFQTAKDAYAALWESINGPGSWDANPWAWVVEFRRIER